MAAEVDEKFLVFSLCGQEYAAEISIVREIRGLDSVATLPDSPDFVRGVMDLRGKVIPLLDLRRRFRMPMGQIKGEGIVIVVDLDGLTAGLVVDRVVEVFSLPPSAWEEPSPLVSGPVRNVVQGMADLSGRIIILLDMNCILTPEEAEEFSEMGMGAPAGAQGVRT